MEQIADQVSSGTFGRQFTAHGCRWIPKPIWDKLTGEIDHEVATYWKENYDLRVYTKERLELLGPKLKGKINIYCGDMDNYYLNNAVYLMEEFLEKSTDNHLL